MNKIKIAGLLMLAIITLIAQETTNEVKVISIDMNCDKCKIGKMRPTNSILTSNPPQYPHVCNNCKTNTAIYLKSYPHIQFN